MIHIVHIIPTLTFGGAERTLVNLINNSSFDFEHSIILFFDDQPLSDQINKNIEIRILNKKGKLSLGMVGDIKKYLKELKPDIVHTHLGGDFWGRIAAKKLNIPVISTEHNVNFDEGNIKRIVRKLMKNYSDRYVAVSKEVSKYVKSIYKIKNKITVIPCGVETDIFKNLPEPNFQNNNVVILGRLVPQKGYIVALEALSKIKDNWNLKIVGNGELKDELILKSKELGLENKIYFLPAVKDVAGILKDSDVLLAPSLWEGLGIVAMEGMAAGRLVIASECGGLKELIQDKKTGLFFKTSDVDDLTEKINWYFENKKECLKIANQGKVYALENFGIKKQVQEYEKLYKEILK